jgi:hypothetical protein
MPLAQFDLGLVHLPESLPANYSREVLPGITNIDTAQTISRMQDMVTLGKRQMEVRNALKNLVFSCPAKDYYCYAEAAHNFCRDEIRYVFDPSGVELVESPKRVLESRVADCDSIVMLMAALCEQMGFECRFVTIKADKARPDDFSHVFLEVKVPNRGWIASDPTQPDKPFGWSPGPEYPRKNWPASKDSPESGKETDEMAGLGYFGDSGMPGVQATPGVIVEKPWQFRDEEATITAHPEQMELDTFSKKPPTAPAAQADSFFYAESLPSLFPTDPISDETEYSEFVAPAPQLSGLGADDTATNIMVKILNGQMYDELVTAKAANYDALTTLMKYVSDPNPARRAIAERARASNLAERQALQEAVNKYSQIVGWIQTAVGSKYSPKQLAGLGSLGFVGVDDAVYVIAAVAALGVGVGVALYALSDLMAVILGRQRETKGYLSQLGDVGSAFAGVLGGSANLVKYGTIAAVVGAALYFGSKILKKRGAF